VFFTFISLNAVLAQDLKSREDAKDFADSAIKYISKVGPRQAFKEFNDKSNKLWHRSDLFLLVISLEGVILAHGENRNFVGKKITDFSGREDKLFIGENSGIVLSGGRWIDYEWPIHSLVVGVLN
jgi:hypothetical protein